MRDYFGTSSIPESPHGWHLKIRRIANQLPFTAPWRSKDCRAYALQVGSYLQFLPTKGDRSNR